MRPAPLAFVLLCGLAGSANAQPQTAAKPLSEPAATRDRSATDAWDRAFRDTSGKRPLHFLAHYVDAHNAVHRLEEWRVGQDHLRRLTDDRIDLHADAATHLPGQPREYVWTILDVQKRIAHRISTVGMLRLGMLYSYYSMAHVLTRPAGQFSVEPVPSPEALSAHADGAGLLKANLAMACRWYEITAPGQPTQRVCWSAQYGVPTRTYTQTPQGWRVDFAMETIDTRAIPAAVFRADTNRFQVRNVDELEAED